MSDVSEIKNKRKLGTELDITLGQYQILKVLWDLNVQKLTPIAIPVLLEYYNKRYSDKVHTYMEISKPLNTLCLKEFVKEMGNDVNIALSQH